MGVSVTKAITVEEFLALPETEPATELWDGQVRQKAMPKTKHSAIQTELAERLNAGARSVQPRHGRALTELRCIFAGRVVVPHVTFVGRDRLALDPDGRLADDFRSAPDLMVEIVSTKQSVYGLVEKLAWCVQNGVRLGWLIDPDAEEVMVFMPDRQPQLLPRTGALDGGSVLPGFRLPVAELFASLREPI